MGSSALDNHILGFMYTLPCSGKLLIYVQCTLYSVQLKTVKLDSTPSQLQVSYSNLTNLPFFKKLSCRNPKEEKMNTERDFLELNA